MNDSTPNATGRNPEKAGSGWPPVVVAGAYQTGVVLMRNLERRGLRVVAFDCNPAQPGFRSVYGSTSLCPDPDHAPSAWLAFMVEFAQRYEQKPVLIPSADQFVSAIAAHARELQQHYTFLSSATQTQALLATKERQYDIAADNGLPTAYTESIQSSVEVAQFAKKARFPCLIKPLHCREWQVLPPGHALLNQKLVIASTPAELLAHYNSISDVTPNVVLQEIIEGPDTAKLCYMGCYSRDGRRLGSCVVRQVRTDPIGFGSASVVEPVIDSEADELSDHFLRSIGYAGLCELELKRDTRDGTLKLIEANPRYSVTSDAAPPSGVDLGWLHYLDLIGQPVTPVTQQPTHYHHIVLRRDFATLRSYRATGMSWSELLRVYRAPVYFFDFDWRDRGVTLATVTDLAKTALYPYLGRFKKTKH